MTDHRTRLHGSLGRIFCSAAVALLIGLTGPAPAGAQSSVGAPAPLDELRRLRAVIADELVGEMDRRIGTPEAAKATLARWAPAESRSLDARAYWLSAHWTTGIGVQFAAGPAFEFRSPEGYFTDHARVLDGWIARAEAGAAVRAGLAAALGAGIARLQRRFALVESGFFDCQLPGLGRAMRQEKVVDSLRRAYAALPEGPDRDVTRASAAWSRYDQARRALSDSTEATARACLSLVASAIDGPVFVDKSGTIGDDEADRCGKHQDAIDKLKAEVKAAENIVKRIEAAIKKARGELAKGEKDLERLKAEGPSQRLAKGKAQRAAIRKDLKSTEDTINQLDALRGTILRQLPDRARLYLAKTLLDSAGGVDRASDTEKRAFIDVVLGSGASAGAIDDTFDAAVRLARVKGTADVAWGLAQLGGLVTKIPTGALDILGTGLKDSIEQLLSDGETDPGFLDAPKLEGRLRAAPGQFKAKSAKVDALITHITSEQKRIATLDPKAADAAAAKLIPVAVELAEEAVALREALQPQLDDLKEAERLIEAGIKRLEDESAGRLKEIAELEESIGYEKDELIPGLDRSLVAAVIERAALEQSLEALQAEHARDCAR